MIHFQFADRFAEKTLSRAAVIALMLAMTLQAFAADARIVRARVAPAYPEIAKRMRVEGTVKLEASVDQRGDVTEVKELSGNHTLALAAKEALMKWKFAPASNDSNETIEISFNLGQ